MLVKPSGKVDDAGLPDCPTYANGLLSGRFLPAIAADLLSRGNPHKPFLHSQKHTRESFVAYLQHGTVLDKNQQEVSQRNYSGPVQGKVRASSACADRSSKNADPYNFVLQFQSSEIDGLVSRRLPTVDQDRVFQAGRSIADGDCSRDNLNVIVAWKMEGVHLTRVMSYLGQNTDAAIDHGVTDWPTTESVYYVAYLKKCRELAKRFNISLRTLDHALWQWGYEHKR